jgi:hypothetical protein
MPATPSPNRDSFIQPLELYHLGPSPGAFVEAYSPVLYLPGALFPDFYLVSSPPGLCKSIFWPLRSSIMMGWTSTSPRRPSSCLTLVLCPQGLPSVGLAPWPCLRGLDTPGPLLSQVRTCRPQEYLESSRGGLPLSGLRHFRELSPLRNK